MMEKPNLDYLDEIAPNDELRNELITLMYSDLVESRKLIKEHSEKNDTDALLTVVHNIVSKFSVLAMQDTFNITREIITDVRDRNTINKEKIAQLLSGLDVAIEFINSVI